MNRITLTLLGLAQFCILQSAFAAPSPNGPLPETETPTEKVQLAYIDAREDRADRLNSIEQARLAEALRSPSISEIQQGALLRLGQQGPAVKEVKDLLNSLGYPVSQDDQFDRTTLNQIGQFQEKHNLVPAKSHYWGIVGPETLEKLQKTSGRGNYNPRFGQALVNYARSRVIGTERYCYRFVAEAIHAFTEPFLMGYHAYMAADYLAKSQSFHEIFPSVKVLEKLPAGAIVVWGKGNSRSGHISIADGQGNEISDHIRPQMLSHYGGAPFRAFLPVAAKIGKQ
ncbi:MAG: peptidoglycan-binding protein [Candidatus Sericytochromatia bacterium]|nr:peptidoglycan-binding protein [Candidatus Sericytochromatia bacterium]